MKERYLIILHDLEDLQFYATEDEAVFEKACNARDLCEWVCEDEAQESLENLGDDITGITVLGMTYGLQY